MEGQRGEELAEYGEYHFASLVFPLFNGQRS